MVEASKSSSKLAQSAFNAIVSVEFKYDEIVVSERLNDHMRVVILESYNYTSVH